MISRLSHQMIKISRLQYRLTFAKMAERGIPFGAPPLLKWISEHEGCHHKDLANNCHLEPATVTSALLTMEKEGLIRREADRLDRRSICIWLTPKGYDVLDQVAEVFQALEEGCFSGFSAEEKKQAEALLDRIIRNMKQLECKGEAKP